MKVPGMRRVRALAKKSYRAFVFRRAMRRFRKDVVAFTDPAHPVFADLVYGWGNPAWSAQAEYLAACIDHALTSDGPILECGSGLSTLLVGTAAQQRGRPYWCLENSPDWATRVRGTLGRYGIESVTISVAPLRDYGDFSWYDPPLSEMPNSFSLVLCDGPPGSTKGGRYGLVPVMGERLRHGCTILLDDAEREDEVSIAERWSAELAGEVEFVGSKKPFARVRAGGHQARA